MSRTETRTQVVWTLIATAVIVVLVAIAWANRPGAGPGSLGADGATTTQDSAKRAANVPAQIKAVTGVHVLADTNPVQLSIDTSQTFFDSSRDVILVLDAPGSATYPAAATVARAAVAHTHAPVLLVDAESLTAVQAEVTRLGATSAIIVDPQAGADRATGPSAGTEQSAKTAPGAGPGTATGPSAKTAPSAATGAAASGMVNAAMLRDWFDATVVGDPLSIAPDPDHAVDATKLSDLLAGRTGGAPAASGVVALTDSTQGAGGSIAASTAIAAGARVADIPGADPRANPQALTGDSGEQPSAVVGLGATFVSAESLEPRVKAATSGVELPGGGQLVLPGKRYIALYGSPQAPVLGVLGEQDVPATIKRARQVADQYTSGSAVPVIPTLEIIVTVASGSPGSDGNYSNERPIDLIAPLVDAAHEAGMYVVLDFQPGRVDFLTQIKQYEQLVARPNVGVALDPEWRLKPDQLPLQQIGSVSVDEINAVSQYLAELVRARNLPQKALVVHQFSMAMVQGRDRLNTTHPELAVVIHADGQGGQGAKAGTWARLHTDAPAGVFWGWKNFYDEDTPMLTPEQTNQVRPLPDFISYQ